MWSVQFFLSALSFLLALLFVSQILRERRAPGTTIAWMLVILLIPYVGVPLYLLIGVRKIKTIAAKKTNLYPPIPYAKTPSDISPVERILLASGAPSKTFDNQVQLLSSGEETYFELIRLIQNAKKSIHIMIFILGRDAVGSSILKLLQQKAQEGVEVRLLLDAFGSFWISKMKLRRFKNAGGKYSFFLPVFHFPFHGHSNLRNHRKLIVVDGHKAIVGGMNFKEEYMGPTPKPKRWVDLSLLIEGAAATQLENLFRSDWGFASGEELKQVLDQQGDSGVAVQVVGSGPDVEGDSLYDSLLSAIFAAEKRIWIATPYFIPDETLTRALELAARRGIDLRILIPLRSNHFLADLCRGSYLKQIQRAGGQICFLSPGMMHAKVTLVDDTYAVIGSANMDMRSLLLNYEVGVFLSSRESVERIVKWFESLLARAKVRPLKEAWILEIIEGIGRILGPIL